MKTRIAVLASGGGTNLQALLDRFPPAGGVADGAVALVISDRPGVGALERARTSGAAGRVVEFGGREEAEVGREILDALETESIDIVALAGFLRRVPAEVVRRFRHRMLNIHPALLPAFGGKGMFGLRVHRAVLDAGCRVTGATIHFVDEEYDAGPILVQWPVPVLPGDAPESVAERVLRVEHRLYPAAVEALVRALVAEGLAGAERLAAEGVPGAGQDAAFRLQTGAGAPADLEIRHLLGLP